MVGTAFGECMRQSKEAFDVGYTKRGFHALIRAQHASAFFDFRGIPTVDFRLDGQKDVTSLTATDAIRYFAQRFQLTKRKMTALRCESILGKDYMKDWKERLPGEFQGK